MEQAAKVIYGGECRIPHPHGTDQKQMLMSQHELKHFGLKVTSRVKAFVFRFVSVPAKWVRTARQHVLNIYSENKAYAKVFLNDFG